MKNVWYKVDRETKEHFLMTVNEHPMLDRYFYVVEADADGWIEWHPRDGQPVQDSQLVDVKCSSQYWEDASGIEASAVGWSKLSTVTHYRPILEPQAEQVKECRAREFAAVKTLEDKGYDWRGGELWAPPLGEAPDYIKNDWRGPEDGLPPVGTVCEFINIDDSHSVKSGTQVEILCHYETSPKHFPGEMVAVFSYQRDALENHDVSQAIAGCFRPIRTDRERWIEAAMPVGVKEAELTSPDPVDGCQLESALGAIYDAGLARLPGELL